MKFLRLIAITVWFIGFSLQISLTSLCLILYLQNGNAILVFKALLFFVLSCLSLYMIRHNHRELRAS